MFGSRNRFPTFRVVVAVAFFLLSCTGGPKHIAESQPPPIAEPAVPVAPEPLPEPVAVAPEAATPAFDPAVVTEAMKSATFVDVRAFIESLNLIIRHQDYEAWRLNLTEDYINYYSDPSVLAKYSEYAVIKVNNIKLQTLRDYFINVVYPSRQNDKVDDIEFVGGNLIKAITVNHKGERNILYMLEKHGEAWKIGVGR
jgi:hypothetical protein